MITVLVLTKILDSFLAIANQKTVLGILCAKDLGGELKD